ncbi:MAG TPA: EF-hand domain-containing protein [Candidatus Acidoferrum sp.]|nr:EF-hand domain-containing protein [Candidatus Acidoferrum sp.]
MKKLNLSVLTLAVLCGASTLPVSAATDDTGNSAFPHHGNPGPMHNRGGEPGLNLVELDTNHDGKISLEEFLAPRTARIEKLFTRLDRNGDGLISQDELMSPAVTRTLRSHHQAAVGSTTNSARAACMAKIEPNPEQPVRLDSATLLNNFAGIDTNGDGKLNLAELTTYATTTATAEFNKLDIDGDGFLTQKDFDALRAQRQANAKAVRDCVKSSQ